MMIVFTACLLSSLGHFFIPQYIVLPSGALLASDVILNFFAFREGPLEFNSSTEDPDYLFTAEPHILKLEESTRVR